MAEPFESRLPAFDPRRTRGVLSGAMQAIYRDPATAAFADTLDHRSLPAGWEDDPHIQRLAADAWQAPDRYNSPFFRAWLGRSRLIGPDGLPTPFYHGSPNWGLTEFRPGTLENGALTGVWSVDDPRPALSYLMRPNHIMYDDEMNRRMRKATAQGLLMGSDVYVPGLGKQDYYNLFSHYEVPFGLVDSHTDLTNRIWDDLSKQDWGSQQKYLEKYFTPGSSEHVPLDALSRVVRMHPAFDEFFDANKEMLIANDFDIDALEHGRKIIGPFTTPDTGKIYPLFVKSERPLVVGSSNDPAPSSWWNTPRMTLPFDSLSPEDLRIAESRGKSIAAKELKDAKRGLDRIKLMKQQYESNPVAIEDPAWKDFYDNIDSEIAARQALIDKLSSDTYVPDHVKVNTLYGPAFYTDVPAGATDALVADVRNRGVYDSVLTRNVYDGGGTEVPPANTAAFLNGEQAKSLENLGTFSPNLRNILRTAGPAVLGGGALAAAMGRPTGASAASLPSGWVPPSAKAELEGMEPSGWMDPVNWLVDAATAGGGAAVRAGQVALGAAQDWLGEQVPQIPEIPEEYREAAQ